MGKSITFTLTLPSLPELPALPDDPWVWAEALGWLVLVLLLLRVLSQLSAIYALLRPHAAKPPALLEMPALLLRKARLVLYGACFLVLSKDKVTSKQLKKAPDAAHATGPVEKKVRLVFIRHGESMWNYAFNRGFKPSFLWRWLETTLYELYLLPLEDSAYAAQLVGAQFGGAQFGAIPPRNSAAQFRDISDGPPATPAGTSTRRSRRSASSSAPSSKTSSRRRASTTERRPTTTRSSAAPPTAACWSSRRRSAAPSRPSRSGSPTA